MLLPSHHQLLDGDVFTTPAFDLALYAPALVLRSHPALVLHSHPALVLHLPGTGTTPYCKARTLNCSCVARRQ